MTMNDHYYITEKAALLVCVSSSFERRSTGLAPQWAISLAWEAQGVQVSGFRFVATEFRCTMNTIALWIRRNLSKELSVGLSLSLSNCGRDQRC